MDRFDIAEGKPRWPRFRIRIEDCLTNDHIKYLKAGHNAVTYKNMDGISAVRTARTQTPQNLSYNKYRPE